jgi:hypothetical protein
MKTVQSPRPGDPTMAAVWKYALPVGALSAAFTTFTITAPTASAFFPPVPQPGDVITVVPPTPQPPAVVPPVPPVCKTPHQPVDPCGCDTPENPQTVPEPGTLLLAGSGLALAALRLRRKAA